MSNKDLLKQAIAEAKTIREAAIANAKEALEETLTPHLKEMLAQKLQEMDKEDEEEEGNTFYRTGEDDQIPNPPAVLHIPKELTSEAEEEEVDAEEKAEETEEAEEEELEIEDMSVEDLKDLIRDIVAQETGQSEEEEVGAEEEGPEGQDDMVSMDDSEEIDINELLAELEGMDDEMEEGKKYKMEGMKKPVDEYGSGYMQEPSDSGAAGLAELERMLKSAANKAGMTLEKFIDYVGNKLHGGEGFGLNKPSSNAGPSLSMKEDLNEALKAVNILRNQLQEVNLLNAKLLYVNKVFKANNLSEGQKVNVIAAFDKAETVKEVKLVFETVSKNVVAKPATIKEHRSFASKATGNAKTTAPKEIISEVSEQVARWQKLAGIK